jgi:hypothetical protein
MSVFLVKKYTQRYQSTYMLMTLIKMQDKIII